MVDVMQANVTQVFPDEDEMTQSLFSYLDRLYPELGLKIEVLPDGYSKIHFRYLAADDTPHPLQQELSRVADAYKAGWRRIYC
jgi:hypothetical protein